MSKILNTIKMQLKNFLRNIWDLFSQLWRTAESWVKDNVHVAVVVTENIKDFVENPVGDFLLTVIDDKVPGDLKEKVKEILPKVLTALHIVDDCKDLENQEQTLICISEKLKLLADDTKSIVYHSLAVTLAKELSDGKIGFSDAIAIVEWYYLNHVKKVK